MKFAENVNLIENLIKNFLNKMKKSPMAKSLIGFALLAIIIDGTEAI